MANGAMNACNMPSDLLFTQYVWPPHRRLLRPKHSQKKVVIQNEPQKFHVSPLTKEMFPAADDKSVWDMAPAGVSSGGFFFPADHGSLEKCPPPDRLVFVC